MQYLSSIFLVPKPNGKKRFILNLKSLNKFIVTSHFKMEDLRTTIKLISKNSFLCTIDLKDAYFLLPINIEYKKYLRFTFHDKLYEFNVLPFGLNTAPLVFTKLMKPVMCLLRSLGYISSIYLDDLCLIAESYKRCQENVRQTVCILESLGFIINYEKSVLAPNTKCKYLGFIIDTKNFNMALTKEKRIYIKQEILHFSKLKRCTIRQFAKLAGLLASSCPAIQYGWLYTKNIERCKYIALETANNNYDSYMTIPEYLIDDFKWWQTNIESSVNPIRDDYYCLEIFSDASKTGWGAACGEDRANGKWNEDEKDMHINYLEILAAFFGLKVFAKDLKNCQILLRIDNTTAISYVNKMGGVRFPHLTDVTRRLWKWCEDRNIYVYASYISSQDNEIADAESRRSHPDIEWELTDHAFSKIVKYFGKPDIDLFATRLNNKCKTYVSWHRDPDALAVNCFTLNWSQLNFYAFPPVSVILKMIRKIITDNAEGIVVVPFWPTQPWFPIFKSLCSDMLILGTNTNVLLSVPNRRLQHKVTLVAARLSARHFHDVASHQAH